MLCLAEAELTITSFLSLIPSLSGAAVLALVVYGFVTGRIVRKGELDDSEERVEEMKAERDEWKNAALRSLQNNERLQGTAQRATDLVVDQVGKMTTRSDS